MKDDETTGKLVTKLCVAYCQRKKYKQAREIFNDASKGNQPAIGLEIYLFSAEAHSYVFPKA